MLENNLKIGTRTSILALKQVEEVLAKLKSFYPTLQYEIVGIDTYGDKDKLTPLSDMEGNDFFTREIEEALLKGKIDFAVHSAKDMPDKIPEGLIIAVTTKPIDPYDALVSRWNLKINAWLVVPRFLFFAIQKWGLDYDIVIRPLPMR